MFTLNRVRVGDSDYININDFQKILEFCMTRLGAGYLSTQYILRSLYNTLEDAKVPRECQDCGEESYIIYPVPIDDFKELKFVCDICYDKKYRDEGKVKEKT